MHQSAHFTTRGTLAATGRPACSLIMHLLRYPGLNRQVRLLHIGLARSVHPLCMMNPSLQWDLQDPGLGQAFKR
jgi:hypothetical protein